MIRVEATRYFTSDENIDIEITLAFDMKDSISWDTKAFAELPTEKFDLPNFNENGQTPTAWRNMTDEEALEYLQRKEEEKDSRRSYEEDDDY